MKTFEEAFDIAQQWETDNITSSSALVARTLFKHITRANRIWASPQVTDEQIEDAIDQTDNIADLRERIAVFRAILSAPPAAETPDPLLRAMLDDGIVAEAPKEAKAEEYPTASDNGLQWFRDKEAKPVAADYSGNWKNCPYPHNFGKPLGFAVVTNADTELPFMLDGGAHTFRREAQAVADSKEYAGTHHVVELWPIVPQEQAPANEDAKDAARYRWWCKTGNDILSSHTIGGKATIDAAIDAGMQSQPQQVTK